MWDLITLVVVSLFSSGPLLLRMRCQTLAWHWNPHCLDQGCHVSLIPIPSPSSISPPTILPCRLIFSHIKQFYCFQTCYKFLPCIWATSGPFLSVPASSSSLPLHAQPSHWLVSCWRKRWWAFGWILMTCSYTVQLCKTSKQTNKKATKENVNWMEISDDIQHWESGILDSQDGETSVNIPGI